MEWKITMKKLIKICNSLALLFLIAGIFFISDSFAQTTNTSGPISPYEVKGFIATETASAADINASKQKYQDEYDQWNDKYETARDKLENALKVAHIGGNVHKYIESGAIDGNNWKAISGAVTDGVPSAVKTLWKTLTNWDSLTEQLGEAFNSMLAGILEFGNDKVGAIERYKNIIESGGENYQKYKDDLLKLAEEAMEPAKHVTEALKGLAMYDTVSDEDTVYKYIDENGNTTYFIKKDQSYLSQGMQAIGIGSNDQYQTVGGVTKGCIPLPAKLAETKSCIFCPLFLTIFNAAQTMATNSFQILANSLSYVMVLGFAIFIAFLVLKYVSAFTKQDAPKFTNEIFIQAFKVIVAFILLSNGVYIYNLVVGPVLSAGLEFGSALLFEKGSGYTEWCAIQANIQAQVKEMNIASGLIPQYLYVKLDCFIRSVQAEIAQAQSIGSSLMCVARNAGAASLGSVTILENAIWDFGMFFQGLIIWGFAILISLAFAFYLIDATVRLGIIGALMPFLIACWPFKVTSGYTKQGWTMFLNTFFTYVMMGLVVSINIQLIMMSLTGGKGGMDQIKSAISGDNITYLQELLDIGFSGFLVLLACCLFGFKISSQATDLAATFAGGGGDGKIGASIGTLAASGAKGLAVGTKG